MCTSGAMEEYAGDDKKDNEKEVASLEDPTPVDMELGAVDDNDDNEKKIASLKNLLLLLWKYVLMMMKKTMNRR